MTRAFKKTERLIEIDLREIKGLYDWAQKMPERGR